nr:hypothetical protein [Tanacetum cinerariifolium]
SEFELESMPDDDLQSLSGSETSVSDSSHDVSHLEHTSWEKTASAEFQSLLGHLDHLCKVVSLLYYKVKEIESSIAQKQDKRTLEAAVIMDDHAEGEKSKKGQMDENANPTTTQGEHSNVEENAAILVTSQGEHKSDNANISSTNEETTLVIHQTANLKTIKDDTDYDELDKNPLSKKFKILTLIPNFPTLTPLCSIPPEHMMKIAPHQEFVKNSLISCFKLLHQVSHQPLSKNLLLPEIPLEAKVLTLKNRLMYLFHSWMKEDLIPKCQV